MFSLADVSHVDVENGLQLEFKFSGKWWALTHKAVGGSGGMPPPPVKFMYSEDV